MCFGLCPSPTWLCGSPGVGKAAAALVDRAAVGTATAALVDAVAVGTASAALVDPAFCRMWLKNKGINRHSDHCVTEWGGRMRAVREDVFIY